MVPNINFFMNVPVEADGTLGDCRRDVRARATMSKSGRRDGRYLRDLQLPAGQQSLQRLQPARRCAPDLAPHEATFDDGPGGEPGRDRRRGSSAPCKRMGVRVGGRLFRGRRSIAPHVRAGRTRRCASARAAAAESYLDADAILESRAGRPAQMRSIRATASSAENAGFAEALRGARASRSSARTPEQYARLRPQAFRPRSGCGSMACRLLPGSVADRRSLEAAERAPRAIGYPVMLKSDGGRRRHRHAACCRRRSFGARCALPPWCGMAQAKFRRCRRVPRTIRREHARHIEVQIFGDGKGGVMRAGRARLFAAAPQPEGDGGSASAQPAPTPSAANCIAAAVRLGEAAEYRSAGTVEFLSTTPTGAEFYLP